MKKGYDKMPKKPTVKDVARDAGVSVATVSYIMNNRTDMKISEATKRKVLQIANLLNYTPSYAAKSLATGQNKIIGVSYRLQEDTPSRNLEITNFVNLLIERLNRMSYDVLFMPVRASQDNIPVNGNVDGIIAIDLSHKEFRLLADNYLVPIINVDMLVNNWLFYQIYCDIESSIKTAADILGDDFYLITDKYDNENYMAFILKGIPEEKVIIFSDTGIKKQLAGVNKIVVMGEYLALLIQPYIKKENMVVVASYKQKYLLPEGLKVVPLDIDRKANLAINYLFNAIDRKCDVQHDCSIKSKIDGYITT